MEINTIETITRLQADSITNFMDGDCMVESIEVTTNFDSVFILPFEESKNLKIGDKIKVKKTLV